MHFPGGRLDAAAPKEGTNPNGMKGTIMKRILGLTTAALMGASVLAAPALAESKMDLSGDAGATTTMPDVDTGTTAAIGGNFESALTAIGAGSSNAQAIGTLSEVDTVKVVSVSDLEGHDKAALDQAVSQNSDSVDELRTSIGANAALSEELRSQGVDTSAVVAAQIEADGQVTVYVM